MNSINWISETRRISDLIPAEYNPRQMTKEQAEQLKKSLDRFNLADPLVINSDNKIIGGHQRYHILKAEGVEEVDVRVPDRKLSEAEEKELNVRLNKNLGEWDIDLLASFDEDMLIDVGFTPEELDGIFNLNLDPEERDDSVPEPRETDIKLGDMFQLGEHRLLCGDATNREDVERLMQGEKADMVFTDPPYGVAYTGGLQIKDDVVIKNNRSMICGDLSDAIYTQVIPIISDYCNGAVYVWFAGTKALRLYEAVEAVGDIHSLIIWVKNGGYGALNANYKQKHEPCLYWKPKGKKLNFVGSTKETTLWDIDKDGINKLHPTQKPVALPVKAIMNHSVGIIADFFGGSGSTLIACEKTNRKCRMMEIDPIYCQVIIDRWEEYSGKTAERI